jgi:excisionase family DNA binding protein
MAEKKYHSRAEAAEILGIHPRTVQRYLLAGTLKGAKFGKAWKISDGDIEAFYEAAKKDTRKALRALNSGKDAKA